MSLPAPRRQRYYSFSEKRIADFMARHGIVTLRQLLVGARPLMEDFGPEAFPPGAFVVTIDHSPIREVYRFLVQSDQFDLVPAGESVPTFTEEQIIYRWRGAAPPNNFSRLRRYTADQTTIALAVFGGSPWQEVVCVDGIPKDAEVVSVHYDFRRRAFEFTVRSETFDVVPEGEEIPLAHPRFKLTPKEPAPSFSVPPDKTYPYMNPLMMNLMPVVSQPPLLKRPVPKVPMNGDVTRADLAQTIAEVGLIMTPGLLSQSDQPPMTKRAELATANVMAALSKAGALPESKPPSATPPEQIDPGPAPPECPSQPEIESWRTRPPLL